MERYDSNIDKLFRNGNLNSSTILQIGIQILNIVEYIHSKGYIHADIKGENILLKENDPYHIYLVDLDYVLVIVTFIDQILKST